MAVAFLFCINRGCVFSCRSYSHVGRVPASKAPPEITINPQRTAVLVLHMMNEQLKYRAGVTGYGPEFAESNKEFRIIENTKTLVDASREKGIQIVYVRMSYRAGYPELPSDEEGMPEKVRLRKQGLYKEG